MGLLAFLLFSPSSFAESACSKVFSPSIQALNEAELLNRKLRGTKTPLALEFSASQVDRVLGEVQFFRSKKFFDLLANRSLDQIETTFKSWYPEAYLANRNKLWLEFSQILPRELMGLILDPGILSRKNEFLSFSEKWLKENQKRDPFQLRQDFSSFLGSKIVYRSIFISDSEAKEFITSGLVPQHKAFRSPKNQNQRDADTAFGVAEFLISGPLRHLRRRVEVQHRLHSITQSVSEFEDLAQVAGAQYKRIQKQERFLYTFKLEVPAIDLVASRDFVRFFPTPIKTKSGLFDINDSGVEHIIYGLIPPAWIKKAEKKSTP